MTGAAPNFQADISEAQSFSDFLDRATHSILRSSQDGFIHFQKDLNHWYSKFAGQNNLADFISFCRKHEALRLFHEEPITYRSFYKPRGYAGDAELIDFLYMLKSPVPKTTYSGRELFAGILESNICKSVRWRAKHLV